MFLEENIYLVQATNTDSMFSIVAQNCTFALFTSLKSNYGFLCRHRALEMRRCHSLNIFFCFTRKAAEMKTGYFMDHQ